MNRSKVRCFLILLFVLLLAGLWLMLLFWLFGYEVFPTEFVSNTELALHVRKSLLSYRSTHSEYASAINGLTYDTKSQLSTSMDITFFKLGDLLTAWNPDNVAADQWVNSVAHPNKGQSLPRFDYSQPGEVAAAFAMRDKELPFLVYNVPELEAAAAGAFNAEQLLEQLGSQLISAERMSSNKYIYFHSHQRTDSTSTASAVASASAVAFSDWSPPQEDVRVTFSEFLRLLQAAEARPDAVDTSQPHYYYTISASEGLRTKWLRDALPFFSQQPSLFMKAVDGKVVGFKGINCRFGMKGVVATNHYDGGRNFVAMIRGRKRYVLLPPSECPHLELHPRGHPSARHTAVDWSDIEELTSRPDMYNAKATEVILAMGEMLYIPSNWFHYIVSQDASIQCNARSGHSIVAEEIMQKCGFY